MRSNFMRSKVFFFRRSKEQSCNQKSFFSEDQKFQWYLTILFRRLTLWSWDGKLIIIKQWPLAPNLRKWQITRANVSNASHIFQKWPLATVGESGESVTAFWRIWRIFKLGHFKYKKKIFLGIKRSSLPSPNSPNSPNSLNSLNSLNTRQIRRREAQKFGGSLVFANSSTRQKRWIFGEYLNSLNSPASGHCLIIMLFWLSISWSNLWLTIFSGNQKFSNLWSCTCG